MNEQINSATVVSRSTVLKQTFHFINKCLMFCRQSAAAPAWDTYAEHVWDLCPPQFKHPYKVDGAAGTFIFFHNAKHKDGHVVVIIKQHSTNPTIRSTDIINAGTVSDVTLKYLLSRWPSMQVLGGTTWINGVEVVIPAPPPKPKPDPVPPGPGPLPKPGSPKMNKNKPILLRPDREHVQVSELDKALQVLGFFGKNQLVTDFYGGNTKAAVTKFYKTYPKYHSKGQPMDKIGRAGWKKIRELAHAY